MKTRKGFVSNSSSSSFVIPLWKMTRAKYNRIKNLLAQEGVHADPDQWVVYIKDGNLYGYTFLDNLCLDKEFAKLKLFPDFISSEEYPVSLGEYNESTEAFDVKVKFAYNKPCPAENCNKCEMRFVCLTNS